MCVRAFGETEVLQTDFIRAGEFHALGSLLAFLIWLNRISMNIYDVGKPGPAPGPVQAEVAMGMVFYGRHTYIPTPMAYFYFAPPRSSTL